MVRLASLIAAAYWIALTSAATSVLAQSVNPKQLILLTTTSTQYSGILRPLTNAFARKSGLTVKTIVAGGSDILKRGSRGEGDVVLMHSPEAEKSWMAEGNGTSRRLVMYDEFVILGPAVDPAKIKGLSVAHALKRIAETKSPFVSRGDPHELAMWKRAGVEPKGQSWYHETSTGKGLILEVASKFPAYAVADRITYDVLALVLVKRISVRILVAHDPALYHTYHVMPVNAAKFPNVNQPAGQAFADWIISSEGQAVIADFGKAEFGHSLFVPAATMREDDFLQI